MFFVCFLGLVPCFSKDAQLRPRVFYLIFRARCGCTSHLFLCAKNANIYIYIYYRKYWPCSTRITRMCQFFFFARGAKSWPGYRDSIAANSHHRSPPHTGGPQVPPPWLVGAGRLDLVRGNLRKLCELNELSAPSALSKLS